MIYKEVVYNVKMMNLTAVFDLLSVVFCFFVGLYLDKWIGTKGIFVTIFTVLGVIGGAVTVYRQILGVIEDKSGSSNNGER